jgi:hypothetical protein
MGQGGGRMEKQNILERREEILKDCSTIAYAVDLGLVNEDGLLNVVDYLFENSDKFAAYCDIVQAAFALGFVAGTIFEPTDLEVKLKVKAIKKLISEEGIFPLMPREQNATV